MQIPVRADEGFLREILSFLRVVDEGRDGRINAYPIFLDQRFKRLVCHPIVRIGLNLRPRASAYFPPYYLMTKFEENFCMFFRASYQIFVTKNSIKKANGFNHSPYND